MTNENEFVNVYIETMFDDINGKNRELIALKANIKVLTKENEDLKAQAETDSAATKDRTHNLETRVFELEQDNRNLSSKLDAESRVRSEIDRAMVEKDRQLDIAISERATLGKNYDLVCKHNEEMRIELETLKRDLASVMTPAPNWEESAITVAEDYPKRRKKGLMKLNAAEVSA